jgi:hypothetical protein
MQAIYLMRVHICMHVCAHTHTIWLTLLLVSIQQKGSFQGTQMSRNLSSYLMMETDPVSEVMFTEKQKTMHCCQKHRDLVQKTVGQK